MFKDKLKKAIPKTLNDCTKVDAVSEQILRWTDSISIIGRIILLLNLIVGLVMSILAGVLIWDITDEYVSWFWPLLIGLIITTVNVLIIHLVFQFVTMLFSALASLVLNTRVTADVGLLIASKEKKEDTKASAPTGNGDAVEQPAEEPIELPIITDEATLEEYKKKIDEFLMGANDCASVSEMLEQWNKLELERHPVVEHIQELIVNATTIERMYGKIGSNVEKTLDKITSYYLKAKFRKEI